MTWTTPIPPVNSAYRSMARLAIAHHPCYRSPGDRGPLEHHRDASRPTFPLDDGGQVQAGGTAFAGEAGIGEIPSRRGTMTLSGGNPSCAVSTHNCSKLV